MEHVLGTRELVDEIFEMVVQLEVNLDNEETDFYSPSQCKTPARTLPALARTSKFFAPSAMRIIWRSIWSIDSLLECLPGKVLQQIQFAETYGSSMVASLDITEADLTRLKSYTELVHEYGSLHAWNFHRRQNILPDYVFESLLPFFENALLLPRLREATFSLNLGPSVALTRLVLGKDRSLDRLRVLGTQTPKVEIQSVEWFRSLALARLRVLDSFEVPPYALDPSLDCRVEEAPAWQDCSLPFCTLQEVVDLRRITSLNIHAISFDKVGWVRHIAEIPHLKILWINLSGLAEISNIAWTSTQACFGALEQAIIIADAPLALCNLLQLWQPNKLRNLTIKRKSRSHLWDFEEICRSLRQTSLSASNLRTLRFKNSLKIDHDHARNYYENTTDISHQALHHLSHFVDLEVLVFDLGSRVTWGDDVLHDIAQYWPGLRSFHVCEWEYAKPSRISPDGVYSFLRSLPRLKNLTLRFNTTKNLTQTLQPLGHLALCQWDLCTSDASDKDRVVNYLKETVPNVESPLLRWAI